MAYGLLSSHFRTVETVAVVAPRLKATLHYITAACWMLAQRGVARYVSMLLVLTAFVRSSLYYVVQVASMS